MATQYEGFDSTVLEVNIAHIMDEGTFGGVVESPTDWAVSTVPGNRRISIAPGSGRDAFVRVTTDAVFTYDLPALTTKGQWFCVAARRDWTTNKMQFVIIPSTQLDSLTPDATPEAQNFVVPPRGIPGAFRRQPGVQKDQMIAWVFANNSTTALRVYDMRRGPNHKPYRFLARRLYGADYNDISVSSGTSSKLLFQQSFSVADGEVLDADIQVNGIWSSSGTTAGETWLSITPFGGNAIEFPHVRGHNGGTSVRYPFWHRERVMLPGGGNSLIQFYGQNDSSSGGPRNFSQLHLTVTES